jgi:hypothetical protein
MGILWDICWSKHTKKCGKPMFSHWENDLQMGDVPHLCWFKGVQWEDILPTIGIGAIKSSESKDKDLTRTIMM